MAHNIQENKALATEDAAEMLTPKSAANFDAEKFSTTFEIMKDKLSSKLQHNVADKVRGYENY